MGLNNPLGCAGVKLPPSNPGTWTLPTASSSACIKGCLLGYGFAQRIDGLSSRLLMNGGFCGISGCNTITVYDRIRCYTGGASRIYAYLKNEDTGVTLYSDYDAVTCHFGFLEEEASVIIPISEYGGDDLGLYAYTWTSGPATAYLYEFPSFNNMLPNYLRYERYEGGAYIHYPNRILKLGAYDSFWSTNPSLYLGDTSHPASNTMDGSELTYWQPIVSDTEPYIVASFYGVSSHTIRSVWLYMLDYNMPAQVTLYGAGYTDGCSPSYTELATKTLLKGWNNIAITPFSWYFMKALFDKQIRLSRMVYEYIS